MLALQTADIRRVYPDRFFRVLQNVVIRHLYPDRRLSFTKRCPADMYAPIDSLALDIAVVRHRYPNRFLGGANCCSLFAGGREGRR